MEYEHTFYDPHLKLPGILRKTSGIDTIHLGDPKSEDDFFDIYRVQGREVKISLRPLVVFDDGVYTAGINADTDAQAAAVAETINGICEENKATIPITRLSRVKGKTKR